MPTVARIESTLGFNDAQFMSGIERAERRAATFGGRVESTFQGLFKRTPGRKAEKALTGFIGDIATGGSVTQSILALAGRFTGLGLAAGVGVGVAVELFDKLHTSVVEVRKAHDALNQQMNKPLALTSIEGLGKAIDGLIEKQSTFTHGVTSYLSDIFNRKGGFTSTPDFGKSALEEQQEVQSAINKKQAAEQLRGQTELVRANVLAGINDPQRKALAELRFKFEDRRNELMASPDKGTRESLDALEVEQVRAEKNAGLGNQGRARSFEDAKTLVRVGQSDLSEEQKNVLGLAIKLRSVKAGLRAEGISDDERRSLILERMKTEGALGIKALPKEAESLPDYQQWQYRRNTGGLGDENDALMAAGLKPGDLDKYGSAGKGKAPSPDAAAAAEVAKLNEKFEKYWGGN